MSKELTPAQDMFDVSGRGLQHHDLRRANERAVMNIVGFNPGVSNAEIARLSGLAPQTVSAILVDIERTGMILRGEVLRGRRGQPATPIFLNPEGAFAIGCEVGWRHLDVVLIDMHANVVGHIHQDYAFPDANSIVAELGAALHGILDHLTPIQRQRTVDLGLAIPTDISRNIHLLNSPPEQAELWERLDIAAELAALSGLEVTVFNDGNAACWAELIASPRPRPADFMYFLLSRYICAGVVGQGTLWEGPTGNSANLGSMLVTKADGPPRTAHDIASLSALEQRLLAAGRQVPGGRPSAWDWDSLEPVLTEWIDAAGMALAEVMFNTTKVLECKLAVIDGIMPKAVIDRLVLSTRQAQARLPDAATLAPEVAAGRVGAIAPALGASELVLYRRHLSRNMADVMD